MDLIDRLREISARIPKIKEHLKTEEATKNALVLPFIQALGYNIFDPTEVRPECVADVGTKKSEKVDYAILKDEQPIILIECKVVGTNLEHENPTQLFRYFGASQVTSSVTRLAVLTNGIDYRFYSDLEKPNVIDEKPFFEFSMEHVTEEVAFELKKFGKDSFDLDKILTTAGELKYTKGIKDELSKQWTEPSEEIVKILAGSVYSGNKTKAVLDQFKNLTQRAFQELLTEKVNERLEKARVLTQPAPSAVSPQGSEVPGPCGPEEAEIAITSEELEAYYAIKAVLCGAVAPERVFHRKGKWYCGVLLDDNNRKPICRLYFSGSRKSLGLFDAERNETRHPIEGIDGLFHHADQLKQTALRYDTKPVVATETNPMG